MIRPIQAPAGRLQHLSHLLLCSLPARSVGPVMNSRKVQVDIGIKQNIKVLKARGVALGKKLIPSLGGYEVFFYFLILGGWCRVCHGQCAEVREELLGECVLSSCHHVGPRY